MALKYSSLSHRAGVLVSGPDAFSFLQGLISNDITKCTASNSIYAAFLTPQGRFQHDLFITNLGGNYFLETDKERLETFVKKLGMYKLRADVTLEIKNWHITAAWGKAPDQPDGTRIDKANTIAAFADPRKKAVGLRMISENAMPETASFADYNAHRINLCLPDTPHDMIPGKSILLESRFDELNGVDFDKGCYLGQEMTARTHFRGEVRKKLFVVEIDGDAPEIGETLSFEENEKAATMCSHQGNVGLILARLEEEQKARSSNAPFRSQKKTLLRLKSV